MEEGYGVALCDARASDQRYRRLTQTLVKGEGSLTDLRIVIESAYSHEILTCDKEFVACGQLANEIVPRPAVSPW